MHTQELVALYDTAASTTWSVLMPTNKTVRCNNCSNYRQALNYMVYRMENNLQCDPEDRCVKP